MKTKQIGKLGALIGALLLCSASAMAAPDNSPADTLVIPKFDVRSDRKTTIRIVNPAAKPVNVQLNYICPGIKHVNEFCSYLDREIELTPYQTGIIDVDDHNPPCEQGYVVARAVAPLLKKPVIHPLYGSYHITDGRRHEANNALPFPNGQIIVGRPNASPGSDLMTDFKATTAGDVSGSRLVLLDLGVLWGMQNPPAVAFIDFWNSAEEPFSTSHEFICWSELQLDEIDANFRAENLGTAHGSLNIEPRPTCPVPGTCPPTPYHIPFLAGSIEEFDEGTRATRNLHYRYAIPG